MITNIIRDRILQKIQEAKAQQLAILDLSNSEEAKKLTEIPEEVFDLEPI